MLSVGWAMYNVKFLSITAALIMSAWVDKMLLEFRLLVIQQPKILAKMVLMRKCVFLFISENMQSHVNIFFFFSMDVLMASGRKANMQRRKWRARKRKRIRRGKWNPAPRDPERRHWRAMRQRLQPPLWQKPRPGNWGGWKNLTTVGFQASWTLEHDHCPKTDTHTDAMPIEKFSTHHWIF